MRHCINSVLALSLLVFALQFSQESSATAKLTAAQCTALQKDLQTYIDFVQKYFGTGATVQKLIAIATADANKLCPNSNHFSTDTEFECAVFDQSVGMVETIGLDASGGLVTTAPSAKGACMSQNACVAIIGQKFIIASTNQTAKCSDPNDQTVLHLTDVEVQTKVNQLP